LVVGRINAGLPSARQTDGILVSAPYEVRRWRRGQDRRIEPCAHASSTAGVVEMAVGDEHIPYLALVDAVGTRVGEDLGFGAPGACINYRQLATAVDDIHMRIEIVAQIEAEIATADEVHLRRESHTTSRTPRKGNGFCRGPLGSRHAGARAR